MGIPFSSLASSFTPRLYVSNPSYFSIRNPDDATRTERTSLRSFIETRCPSFFKPFYPAWWLHSGHLQTAYCVVGNFSKIDNIVYDRKLLRLKDGGTIGIDFTPPAEGPPAGDTTPVIVVLHGLTGGSHESYVRSVLTPSITPKEQGGLGYRAVVVNFRGCAGVPLTSGQFYSAGHTDDFRQALIYIWKTYPNAPLIGVGFSLGANVMIRYLAEEGDRSRLRAGCALGCPWDLERNSDRLESNWFLKQVYSKGMGGNLKNLLSLHLGALAALPPSSLPNDLARRVPELFTIKSPTLRDVDSRITSQTGGSSPPFPFASAHDYYRWASSHRCLGDIRVPLLAVNADDDPIVRYVPHDVGQNGLVALIVTHGGGHLGWFELGRTYCSANRWISKPVVEWLKATEDLVDEERPVLAILEVDGWTTEEGREHLGYREIEGGGRVEGAQGEGALLAGL